MIDIVFKLPYEEFPRYIDFAHDMVADETIINADTVVTCVNQETGLDSKTEIIASELLQGRKIRVILKAGVLGQIHKITVKVHTNLDNILEKEVFLHIRRDPTDNDYFFKQPAEEYSVGNDFVDDLEAGDSVSSHSVLATKQETGADATAAVIKGSGLDNHSVHLHVGVFATYSGEYHLLEMRIVTALGYKYAKQLTMITKEL